MVVDARLLSDLSAHLERCRRMAEAPPVLLLGAGASVKAGLADMKGLYRAAGITDGDAEDAFERFCAFIATRSAKERYLLLAEHLEVADPFVVTPGYDALAHLCAEGYFDVVLSTNLDPLLDDALMRAPLRRRDYVVLINGFLRPDLLGPVLDASRPRLKIIKLHGDLFHRQMAWTSAEMEQYVGSIGEDLRELLRRRDVLVVGYSLRDPKVRELVLATKGDVWFSHPVGVPPHLDVSFAQRSGIHTLLGEDGTFEALFTGLAARLGVGVPLEGGVPPVGPAVAAAAPPSAGTRSPVTPNPATRGSVTRSPGTPSPVTRGPAAPPPAASEVTLAAPASALATGGEPGVPAPPDVVATVDDFRASVFAVAMRGGAPHSTAFLLAVPRVIVCDGWSLAQLSRHAPAAAAELELVTGRGDRMLTRRLAQHSHPFGPALLEVPEGLRAPGLRFRPHPIAIGTPIRVAIAVGEGRGVANGSVAQLGVAQRIAPLVEPVGDLVDLACAVAPGASGAPVVDDRFGVVGFIVAGRDDRPESTMYEARAWQGALQALVAARGAE